MTQRILCFGDSNTYGYDPRDVFGGRYPANARWPELLAAAAGWQVLNAGENGREIPHTPFAFDQLDRLLRRSQPLDGLVLLLGTNDLLRRYPPDADAAAARMEALLARLRADWPGLPVLLIAPPPLELPKPELERASLRLAGAYAALAQGTGTAFADAGQWALPLAFDGVHLTEEAHRIFARQAEQALRPLVRKK